MKVNHEVQEEKLADDGDGSAASDTREVAVVKSRGQKLAEILGAHRGERHVIVLHDYPDPDAISAAYAHRLISAQFEIGADIIYGGKISHQQNIALVKLLVVLAKSF